MFAIYQAAHQTASHNTRIRCPKALGVEVHSGIQCFRLFFQNGSLKHLRDSGVHRRLYGIKRPGLGSEICRSGVLSKGLSRKNHKQTNANSRFKIIRIVLNVLRCRCAARSSVATTGGIKYLGSTSLLGTSVNAVAENSKRRSMRPVDRK